MKKIVCFLTAASLIFVFLTSCGKTTAKQAVNPGANIDYSEMVTVPGGTFMQTDCLSNFSHTITAFKIARYETTYELWYRVYKWAGSNGYAFASAGKEGNDGWEGAAPTAAKHEPVTLISWRDVIVWCNAYSSMNKLKPVYYSDAVFTAEIKDSRDRGHETSVDTAAGGCDNPYADWSANGYRLPTEGEWQYAAGYVDETHQLPCKYPSGSTADYDDPFLTDQVAWYYSNSDFRTKNAGTKNPNKLGIYDMSGNVFEWCWDWYGAYPADSVTDYRGPGRGLSRIRRGGSYNVNAYYTPVGYRFSLYPYHGDKDTGFRLAVGNTSQKAK